MRPLINLLRPGFDDLSPPAIGLYVCYSLGTQHAFDFLHRHCIGFFGYDQADEVIHIGKTPAVESVNGYLAVQSERAYVVTRPADIRLILIQAMNEIAVAGA